MCCFVQPVCICKHERENALLYQGLPKQHSIISKELWQVGVSQGSDKNHILTEVWVCSLQRPKNATKNYHCFTNYMQFLKTLLPCHAFSSKQVISQRAILMCLVVTFNILFLSLSRLSTCV